MRGYSPDDLEQIPLASQEPYSFDPDAADNVVIDALGIDRQSYRYVGQGKIYTAEAHITTMRSEGFVNCSAFIMRAATGDTFAHFWPTVSDLKMEEFLERQRQDTAPKQAVWVYGTNSESPGFEPLMAKGYYGDITTRAINIDSGSTWWGAVFDSVTGDLSLFTRKPTQSKLTYHLFDN